MLLLHKITKENISELEDKIYLNIPSSSDYLFRLSLGTLENKINRWPKTEHCSCTDKRELTLDFVGSTLKFIESFLLVLKNK